MNKRLVIVDGYNLIRNDATLSAIEARSLDAGRRALISRLMTSFDQNANEITIVFDGSAAPLPLPASERHGRINVVFSRRGESADTVIKRMLAAAPPGRTILMLSDDGELRSAAQAAGGVAGGAADRARARPLLPRSQDKDQDEPPRSRQKKGNPRRAKKRSRIQPTIRW